MPASKYSDTLGPATNDNDAEPRSSAARATPARTLYSPISDGVKTPLYSPGFATVQSSGTSSILPLGSVTCATADALFTGAYSLSRASTTIVSGCPGSRLSCEELTSTRSGTSSTNQRNNLRQNVRC